MGKAEWQKYIIERCTLIKKGGKELLQTREDPALNINLYV